MAMGICRQGSLSGGELGREIPSAVRGTVQLPFNHTCIKHICESSARCLFNVSYFIFEVLNCLFLNSEFKF
ncbi:hypothetical protein Hanom_Chr09g00761041 [Helianthus anomalus]